MMSIHLPHTIVRLQACGIGVVTLTPDVVDVTGFAGQGAHCHADVDDAFLCVMGNTTLLP